MVEWNLDCDPESMLDFFLEALCYRIQSKPSQSGWDFMVAPYNTDWYRGRRRHRAAELGAERSTEDRNFPAQGCGLHAHA